MSDLLSLTQIMLVMSYAAKMSKLLKYQIKISWQNSILLWYDNIYLNRLKSNKLISEQKKKRKKQKKKQKKTSKKKQAKRNKPKTKQKRVHKNYESDIKKYLYLKTN